MLGLLDRWPKWAVFVLGLLLLGLFWLGDFLTGPDVSFLAFYFLPLALVTWHVGRIGGYAISLASAVAWLTIRWMSAHEMSVAAPAWNLMMHGGVFVIFTLTLDRLHAALLKERRLARTDPLTGALNRRAFVERMAEEVQRAQRHRWPMALAYLDVDDFKSVNDRLGHAVGDAVLQTVAWTLLQNTRSSDAVARVGGDEFVLLLPQTDEAAAHRAIEKLRGTLLAAMAERGWTTTFSIGVVSCPRPPDTADALLRQADEVMYASKKSGKNRITRTRIPA